MIPLASDIKVCPVRVSEDRKKLNYIHYILRERGYDVGSTRDALRIIEKHGVDKFDFDYPYGSFEEFKKHVLAGEFDIDIEAMMMTDEEIAEQEKAIREGRLRVTY